MVWNPFKLILLCILVSFFEFATTKAQDTDASFLDLKCFGDKTTTNSSYARNLRTLVSSLSSTAADQTFYNNTVLGTTNPSDTVYGLFMCRSDIPLRLCNECVENATKKLSSDPQCSLSTQGMIWYDECMVRYSNAEFFSTVETHTGVCVCNVANISSNPESFMNSLSNTMNQTAEKAASSSNSYSTKQETLSSQNQTIYCLAQCTQDLSPQQCQTCLTQAIVNLPRLCGGKQGGKALFPSCNIRYELYPFYRDVTNEVTPQGLDVPETKYPKTDSEYLEDSGYLSHNCSSNDNITTGDSAFQSNLGILLSDLTSNATTRNGFQAQEGTAYGLFTCRGDIPRPLCEQCVQNATDRIFSECRRLATTEAIIWYNHCWLRYSDRNFFSSVETSPMFRKLNITNTNPVQSSVVGFQLSNKLAEMANKTGDRVERYQTGSLRLNDNQTLYVLGQCSLDLSSNDCGACLSDVIGMAIPWSTLGSVGGRVSYPSCNLRFELFKFYDLTLPTPTSTTPPPDKGRSKNIILILTPTIIVSGILFTFCCYLIRRKARRNNKSILQENFGHESSTIESLQFNLATIEAATNNFSSENKIGKGGFGEVYQGILIDGRPIAVKRLSRNSKQGVEEFKNEILLIAKLQHRNLVAFIGFCLDEQEKILIYEYVPNKSLDYFLFDTNLEKALSWFERYKIIGGIARGILYLHELSRLKVIHRDLKPSNVLLDENMNPKISDFGLARIIEIDQQEGSTNRIIGTYVYMSPEYAMFGQFSEKSDVYSFGVMILEIISGKNNRGSYNPNRVADALLKFVWKHWKDETPLDILDPTLKENYSNIEVIKCIQIGLLCVQKNLDARPTMVTIFSYLTGQSVELPSPQDPTFLLYQGMDPMVARESSLRHANSSIPSSINEMSISEFYPR